MCDLGFCRLSATLKTSRLWPTHPAPASTMCAKLTTNMSHKDMAGPPDIDNIKVWPDLPVAPD